MDFFTGQSLAKEEWRNREDASAPLRRAGIIQGQFYQVCTRDGSSIMN